VTRAADVAVVGGGVIGLAAADSLATNGVDVRCFEPAAPGSGQSAGLTRVFRHIHDTPELVRLAHVARRGWDAWSERAGEQLVGREGVLFAAPSVEAEAALLADAGLEHRLVDENEQRELLPALDPPAPMALFDAGGGAIRVRPTIDSLVAALGDRLVREEVLALQAEDDNGGATLFTSEGLWRSDRVLVCAGVRTAELARASGLELSVDTSLHVRVTFAVRPEHRGAALACWYDRTRRHGPGVYAGPLAPDRYVVGVGTDDQGGDDPGIDAASRYVERALPGLDPQPVAHRPCWLTMLPWHADAFAVWAAGPLLFFGGHNLFKFAPVLGALLARAATTGQIPAELTPPR
jgi:sarcosine oxidase